MEKVKNISQYIDAIAISQIIFDHTEWVSAWGYLISRKTRCRMDFVLTFDTLNKLLRYSGETGDKAQMLLVEKFEKGLEEPTVLDLEGLLGEPQYFDKCRIEVSKTGIRNKKGEWETDTHCLSIDDVSPKLNSKTPVLAPGYFYKQNLSKCTELLSSLYELYLGYQELGFDEKAAIKEAELEDDLKFKMAYYAWEIKKNS
ncbi:MAG: hypothetical protein ACRDE2_08570 [Chitinophagaceae bacterium]